MKPLCIDLFCGLGGWAEGFLAKGWDVIGFDVERHDYGTGGYPGQFVLQDVLTLHGSQFRGADCIVASPPCQRYSYMAMPWSRSKALAAWYRGQVTTRIDEVDGKIVETLAAVDDPGDMQRFGRERQTQLNALFDACFRIQREASEAAGRYIPLVVENVKGAQPWVGRARWHYGSFYLWGDVPALMPSTAQLKGRNNFHFYEKTGLPSPSFQGAEHERAIQRAEAIKNNGGSWFAQAHNTESGTGQNPVNGVKVGSIELSTVGFNVAAAQRSRQAGVKQHGSGRAWFDMGIASLPSDSKSRKDRPGYPYSPGDSRKAASAQIAKIPFPLASWIAQVYYPRSRETSVRD